MLERDQPAQVSQREATHNDDSPKQWLWAPRPGDQASIGTQPNSLSELGGGQDVCGRLSLVLGS